MTDARSNYGLPAGENHIGAVGGQQGEPAEKYDTIDTVKPAAEQTK